jgi:hypothetical protein
MNSSFRRLGGALAALIPLALAAVAAPPTFEVVGGPHEAFEQAVSLPLSAEQVQELTGMTLVEAEGTVGRQQPVGWALDRTGASPVLAWVMPGITLPGSVRRFTAVPGQPGAAGDGDLRVSQSSAGITLGNAYFAVTHPRRGGGGFPREISFRISGNRDAELFFLDRLFRPGGESAGQGQFMAADDPDSSAEVVFESPVRVVVEARTRYTRNGSPPPGAPRLVYRYVYAPFSPVIEVTAEAVRDDAPAWNEQHFLHLSRKAYYYSSFVSGPPAREQAMQTPGAKSRALSAPGWAVMATAADAVGVGGGPVSGWDASDQFVYYVVRNRGPWADSRQSLAGCLYFGPAAADLGWYERWLGGARAPQVRVVSTPTRAAADELAPAGGYELRNEALRLRFADAAGGFACTGIRNLLGSGARFVHPRDPAPGLWRLTFRASPPARPAGSTGAPADETVLDNRAAAKLAADASDSPEGKLLTFTWKGLDLPGEPGAVDVTATVLLKPGRGESEWRLSVVNRSPRFGLAETAYPLLAGVCLPGAGDVLLPRGNWGGTLVRQSRAALHAAYPSAGCPVQFMAFNLGSAGLYLGAHDEGARTKRLVISPEQDASIVTLAENAGVAGSSLAAPFPVVLAAYEGDWWQAAKRYRAWATGQTWTRKGWLAERTDVPKLLRDLGLWWLASGTPEALKPKMLEAEKSCPLPIGLHWYCWHEIPFDNSYPEYFPTKPGFAEAVRELTARGQVIMPYINGRLWDRDIPSFAETGAPAACKQPSGEIYIEEYGSKRKLAPMCPATALWQDKVAEICHRLMTECGVNAIYLDQIGAAAPAPCFDPAHGHPLGGGRHWVDGYRVMLDRIKTEAAALSVGLTTENTAEPYMDNIDAYLAWNPRYDTDVPLLPAVYSGYTLYFTSPQDAQDDLDAFVMAQARDFLWGCQLGWNGDWLLRPEHRAKLDFELALSRLRLAAQEFMVYGELLDEIRPLNSMPVVTAVWNRTTRHTATLPAVQGTLWRSRSGRLAALLVNTTDHPAAITYDVRPGDGLPGAGADWLVQRLTANGLSPWQRASGATVRRDEVLEAREIRAVIFARPDPNAASLARAAAGSSDPILAACAREFLFAVSLEHAGLEVTPPTALQEVVAGEPLALEVRIAARARKTGELTVRWPDGAVETVSVGRGEERRVRRLVWAGTGAEAQEVVSVGLQAGPEAFDFPVRAVYRPALELNTGCPATVRGGESFVMPATVVNHSRIARQARVVFESPAGWLIEPATACDLGRLLPGESRGVLLKVRVPPASADQQASFKARVVEEGTRHDLLVLKSRPLASARRWATPPTLDGSLTEWSGEPTLHLGAPAAETVKIATGYGGAADCSADVWVGWDESALYLAVAVTDDVQRQDESGFQLWRGDCIQLAFRNGPPNPTSGYEGSETEVGLTLGPQGPVVFQWMPGAAPCTEARLAVRREGTVTRYEAAIPWSTLGVTGMRVGRRLAWSMTVNDNDGEGFRGWLEWTPGVCGSKDSSAFGWFEAAAP